MQRTTVIGALAVGAVIGTVVAIIGGAIIGGRYLDENMNELFDDE